MIRLARPGLRGGSRGRWTARAPRCSEVRFGAGEHWGGRWLAEGAIPGTTNADWFCFVYASQWCLIYALSINFRRDLQRVKSRVCDVISQIISTSGHNVSDNDTVTSRFVYTSCIVRIIICKLYRRLSVETYIAIARTSDVVMFYAGYITFMDIYVAITYI